MSDQLKKTATPIPASKPPPKVRATLVRWLLMMVVGVLAYGFGLWQGQEFKSHRDQDRQMASVGGTANIQSNTATLKSHSESH